jgi:hypothetical protein
MDDKVNYCRMKADMAKDHYKLANGFLSPIKSDEEELLSEANSNDLSFYNHEYGGEPDED